ncbi:hypothetical protein EDC04DRAFT_1440835 [Pisolithus marmoratus]|nr:hypothetical protein EDC04DRAFT_1440835 [Pisolithus marmoratus]
MLFECWRKWLEGVPPNSNSKKLLDHIKNTFVNTYCEHEGIPVTGRLRGSYLEYDRQFDTLAKVHEIEALQVQLDATENEEEQRALEEDITGRILWLCWCGICAEVDELLPKVVGYIRGEGDVEGLREIYRVMNQTGHIDPNDAQAHLRRIMLDARAGISKHQLLLAARAADQAKWSGATRVSTIANTQGPTPSTSAPTPSTPMI